MSLWCQEVVVSQPTQPAAIALLGAGVAGGLERAVVYVAASGLKLEVDGDVCFIDGHADERGRDIEVQRVVHRRHRQGVGLEVSHGEFDGQHMRFTVVPALGLDLNESVRTVTAIEDDCLRVFQTIGAIFCKNRARNEHHRYNQNK